MARPHKFDLQYFPLDVNFFKDHKLLMLEEDHGIMGGYIALRLLAMVYEQGYYLDWKDRQELSIAKRIGNGTAGALVFDVVKSCLKYGLFDKTLYDGHKVLSSKGIQKRWLQVMIQLRRKPKVDVEFWLLSSEETPSPVTLTPLLETFSTQKEIKVNKMKVNIAADKSVRHENIDKLQMKEIEPFWQDLVETWFNFGIEKFKVKPGFDRDDPKIFKRILQRLKNRAADQKIEWTKVNSSLRLKLFLETAYADKWLSNNFLLSNLERQFDKFIQNQSGPKAIKQPITDINYLYQRFLEGNLDKRLIAPDHFTELSKKHEVVISAEIIRKRMNGLLGNNIYSEYQLYQDYERGKENQAILEDKSNLQKLAVLQYFEKLKKLGISLVD